MPDSAPKHPSRQAQKKNLQLKTGFQAVCVCVCVCEDEGDSGKE